MRFTPLDALAALCFLAIAPVIASAQATFVPDAAYTLPGFTAPLRDVSFGDIDRDGAMELLVLDSTHLFLYSPTLDSIIFSRERDSSYPFRSILLGDGNRDSIPDIVVVTSHFDSLSNPDKPMTWQVTLWDGQSQFAESAAISISTISDIGNAFEEQGSSSYLGVTDIDSDGYNELAFSYSSSWMDCIIGCMGGKSGNTFLYYSFPDSILVTYPVLTNMARSFLTKSGLPTMLLQQNSREFSEIGSDYSASISSLSSRDLNGSQRAIVSSPFDKSCGDGFRDYISKADLLVATGDISGIHSGQEILVAHRASLQCSVSASYSEASLHLFAMPTTDTLTELWSRTIPSTLYSETYHDFLFHPSLPGHFFAFSDAMDTLYIFRGHDGIVQYGITDIPSGYKRWLTTWTDSLPRLFALNGAQVAIYKLDVATGIDNPDTPSTLPTSFALGRPYPNPFNAELSIPVTLAHSSTVTIDIINILGQPVATLARERLPGGASTLTWNAGTSASGIYFIRATDGALTHSAKVILLK